jgi:DnaJ-class molecular chaperone
MANPFFSGRIPTSLAEKIDAHLFTTGETRSELLIRLLRAEVGDNNADDKSDNLLLDLLARVEKLEQATDNNLEIPPIQEAEIEVPIPTEMSWEEFHEFINEPLPSSRSKVSGDKSIILAGKKGYDTWKYDIKSKKFISVMC